jgi:hypothetical protein
MFSFGKCHAQARLAAFVVLACGAGRNTHHGGGLGGGEIVVKDQVQRLLLPARQGGKRSAENSGALGVGELLVRLRRRRRRGRTALESQGAEVLNPARPPNRARPSRIFK